jgi:DNA-binding response OmpR family regulator
MSFMSAAGPAAGFPYRFTRFAVGLLLADIVRITGGLIGGTNTMARLLIVEDSDSYAGYVREILAPAHEVDIAPNGRDAERLIRRRSYDLIITDIFMPERDGLETIRLMRREMPRLPIIAMSGTRSRALDFLQIASAFGATHTIRKPFQPAELIALVAAALAPDKAAGTAPAEPLTPLKGSDFRQKGSLKTY